MVASFFGLCDFKDEEGFYGEIVHLSWRLQINSMGISRIVSKLRLETLKTQWLYSSVAVLRKKSAEWICVTLSFETETDNPFSLLVRGTSVLLGLLTRQSRSTIEGQVGHGKIHSFST